jgi:hypothetical protein
MDKRWKAAPALLCGTLLLGGCSDEAATGVPAKEPRAVETSSMTTQAATSPVDGTWKLEQTRADVVSHLDQHGFGRLSDRFLRTEQVWAKDHWEWEFADGYFTATWLQPDGAWKVADYGSFEVRDDQLSLTFQESGSTTRFSWQQQDDELVLEWRGVDADPLVKGIPDEAFWRAYLSEPLTRVD